MSIRILPQEVVNQIAAGEVVERPAHLIKELIENSLDAESTQIHIESAMGGRFMKVTDDGKGIEKSDLALALTRHATSKISKTDDIWNLATFGFRGEALASASAISKLNLVSKSHKDSQSYAIQSDFGKFSKVIEGAKAQGTEIKIESLFENVPARLKFLKSDSAEMSQIRNVIKAMALLNPSVEFKLTEGGKLDLFYSKKQNSADRVKEVLGVKKVYHSKASREGYTAEAFYCSPEEVGKTSKNIWIFAQRRWIQDRGLQAAVMEAYRNLLMHGEYPQCVINLTCPTEDIDVNMHPTKSQVKFQNPSLAFRAVQASLRDGLEQAPWIERKPLVAPKAEPSAPIQVDIKEYQPMSFADQFEDHSLKHTQFKEKTYQIDSLSSLKVEEKEVVYEKTKAKKYVPNLAPRVNLGYWSTFQVIGQADLTYIVCQKDDKLILVDQHAAHERVAYEKLMAYWKSFQASDEQSKSARHLIAMQDYLFPLAVDLTNEKVDALVKHEDEIKRMGIEIETLGPQTIGVKSAPLFIKESVFPMVFEKMSEDILNHGGSHHLERVISDLFATMACHSVIRAGQSLSFPEMKELLLEMDQFPLSSFCPHGRPVSVEMTFKDIEKMFGRLG